MPYMPNEQRQQGGYAQAAPRRGLVAYDDYPPIPMPDQSRYGPRGTTDTPRFRADGRTPWPRETDTKGDTKR